MSETDLTLSSQAQITAEEITQRSFSSKVRGISETEVRSYLRRVSEEITRLLKREETLVEKVASLEKQLQVKPQATKQELLERLGEQTSRILVNAESAAEQMIKDAKERSNDMLEKAKKSYEELQIKTADEKVEIEKEIEALLENAKKHAEKTAGLIIEEARKHGREIFEEATITREKILKDLLRRRELLTEQIDELRKGREELLDSYKVVKSSFQKATDALVGVEEKASSELMSQPIDVDELLAAHMELPAVLNSQNPVESFEELKIANEIEVKDEAPEEETSPSGAVKIIENKTVENSKEIYNQEEETADKKSRSFKGYMKDAFGVDNKNEVIDIRNDEDLEETVTISKPSTNNSDLKADDNAKETAKSSVALKEKTQAEAPEKKDVSELFKNLKGNSASPAKIEKDSVMRKTEEDPETIEQEAKKVTESKKKATKKVKGGSPIALRDEVVATINSMSLRKAKKQLQNEQNELLDALRTTKSKKRLSASDVLPASEAHKKMWIENIREEIETVFAAGVSSVSKEKIQASDADLETAIGWIINPLRESLTQAIDEGDADDVTTRVGAKYREWRNNDLKISLTDSLCAVYSLGVVAASPKGTMLKWVVEKAGQCVDCDDNALEPTKAGEQFPTGQSYAPAHSGCRCVLANA